MVSILMSLYNSGKFLRPAIESTLNQTYRDFEFLIIDDGSTDNSLAIAQEYAANDSRIRIIAHPNWGAAEALNDAAKQASCDWLFRMDPDDIMLPNRLERQLDFLEKNPDLVAASALVEIINGKGEIIGRSRSPFLTREAVRQTVAGTTLIGFNHPVTGIKRSVFLEVGGFRKQYWPADDLDLWNRIAERGHMMLVQPEYLLQYRVHSSSISISTGRHQVQTIDWVEDSKNRRRRGGPELTFAEFRLMQDQGSFTHRFNSRRKVLGRTLFKAATHHYTLRRYGRFLAEMVGSLLLEPSLGLSRILPRLMYRT